jgi:hypothetical protein
MKRLTVDRAYHPQEWEKLMWNWSHSMPRRLLFNDLFITQSLEDL